ncbi:hypothetical protein [Gemmata sp.]|uniref:hypothetical protein n=1 Tax=Gemmata sp. TaxID=1914242 RepID=UPI003F704516
MVSNITPADVALLELASGATGAPSDVIERLRAGGFVTLDGGTPTLTAAGATRAEKLRPAAFDIRAMFGGTTSNGGTAISAPGGSRLHC